MALFPDDPSEIDIEESDPNSIDIDGSDNNTIGIEESEPPDASGDCSDKNGQSKTKTQYETELSHILHRKPELAVNSRVVGAIDAGVRYPISVAVVHPQSTKAMVYTVRKGHLYMYENEQSHKLEEWKLEREDVKEAELKLASSRSKKSANYHEFVNGYFKDWLAVHELLYEFYGQRKIRNLRFHTAWARKRLYDLHVIRILAMFGLKPNQKIPNHRQGEYILTVEDGMIGTKHKGNRPSKHAAFWRYFIRKVSQSIIYCDYLKQSLLLRQRQLEW